MRSKFTHLLLLTAWLLATGVQWDVVQVVAWARMFGVNARVLPWRDALELTFAPDQMCGACRAVQAAKQDESGSPGKMTSTNSTAKEPLVFQAPLQIVVAVPAARPWIELETGVIAHERAAPPTPPPRELGA